MLALMLPQAPFKGISLRKSVDFKHNLVTSNIYFWVPKNKSDALFSSSFSVLNHREHLPAWYRQIQELPTFEDSAALGRGRKLRKRGRETRAFFSPSLHRAETFTMHRSVWRELRAVIPFSNNGWVVLPRLNRPVSNVTLQMECSETAMR